MTGLAALIPLWAYYVVPWALALALAAALTPRLGIVRALGVGLMTVPLARTVLGIVDSFGPLVTGGAVLRAYTTYELSGLYAGKLARDLGYLGVGFLLYAAGPRVWHATPASVAIRLREVGLPMGRRGEGASAFVGLVAFPALLLGTLAFSWATAGLQSLRQSDESSVFANMTAYHAVLISAAAAFGEELLYRGLLFIGLLRLLAPRTAPGQAPPWTVAMAIALQAVVFGFAHAGYATWIHVLLPTLFGIVAGIAAWRFGIWSAIVLHVAVDLFAFGAEVGGRTLDVLAVAFSANVAVSLGALLYWGLRWHARRATPPVGD